MSAKEELFDFIAGLSEDQVAKLFNHLSELPSLLEEASQPCLGEQSLQNQ